MPSQTERLAQSKMGSNARGSFEFRAQSLFVYLNTFAVVNIYSAVSSSVSKTGD